MNHIRFCTISLSCVCNVLLFSSSVVIRTPQSHDWKRQRDRETAHCFFLEIMDDVMFFSGLCDR